MADELHGVVDEALLTEQRYEDYTAEQAEVWSILVRRQRERLGDRTVPAYFEGLERLGVGAERIPDLAEVGARLVALTGWRLQPVVGELGAHDYFGLMSRRRAPVTCWVRSMAELDRVLAPDMFHDFMGHVPLLANPVLARWIHHIACLAMARRERPQAHLALSHLNKWTTEWGLVRSGERVLGYGAGFMSSPTELDHALCCANQPATLAAMLGTRHHRAELQAHYFVLEELDALSALAAGIEASVDQRWPATAEGSPTVARA
jgi:phenylalanine-4-hydroxylase